MLRNKFSLIALASLALYREGEPGTDGATAATPAVAPAASSPYVDMQQVSFHFKKEKLRDEKGVEIGEGIKLPKADLYLPIPKADRLVEILNNEGGKFDKERALLLDAVSDVVYGVARGQINAFRENAKETPVTQSVLNLDKLDWTAIANMPRGERASSVPSDEDIQAFLDSYLQVMPEATNKSKEKIEVHIALFKTGFKKQRSQKDVLEVFKNALGIYATSVDDSTLEDHGDVITYFSNKLDRMLKSEEKITMEDI